MFTAICLVGSLAWVSLQKINSKNGFNRTFITRNLQQLKVADKDKTIKGISGSTPYHIYFKTSDPAKLWVTDSRLENGRFITMKIPNGPRVASAFNTVVDSPAINVLAGNVPGIIKTDLNGGDPFIKKFPTALFTRAVVIGNETYVFRGFDTTEKKAGQIFIKGNPHTMELVRAAGIIERGKDAAGISTDGYLNYDKQTSFLVYVSFYRNKFFCIDTNLNLIHTWHTIDTLSNLQVETGESGNQITNTSPAREVNTRGRVSNGHLFNISGLRGDNENTGSFGKNAVADIYELKNGNYKGSLYIPYYKREKIADFRVIDDKLLVLYSNHMILYQLPPGY